MKQKNVAIFLFLSAMYLLSAFVTFQYDNAIWMYATKKTLTSFWYEHIFYFMPTLCIFYFGWIAAWYLVLYGFFTSYLFFLKPFSSIFQQIVAGFCNIFLVSILVGMHVSAGKSTFMWAGFFGYAVNTIINDHAVILYPIMQLLFIGFVIMTIEFGWFTQIRNICISFFIRMKKLRCIDCFYQATLYCGGVVLFILKHATKNVFLLIDIVYKKYYFLFKNKTFLNQYNKVISEIHSYLIIFSKHQEINIVTKESDVTLSFPVSCTNDSIIKKEELEDEVILSKIRTYASVPAIFFDENNNDQLLTVLQKEAQEKAIKLEEKLKRFGVSGRIVQTYIGPLVTVFEYEPDVDTKLSKIVTLEDDLAMVLQAVSVRILAPIPGKAVVGFEVANAQRQPVLFKELFVSSVYQEGKHRLPIILGADTTAKEIVADLANMPHLLIAGSTGSGKSVALNSMLISLLSKRSFDDLKLILIDPKRLEFMSYADIPHLIFPIITHPKKAVDVLKWLVHEMDRRYEKMSAIGVRDCQEYNKKQDKESEHFPFIVVVIDEFADLMITVKKDIEDLITRIAQMARAAGIHMIIATQRPSVDVITGLIKVNFTSRIALRVASKIDSRTILDTNGAERLLAKGDMLFLDGSLGQLKRIHGPYISSQEIERVVKHLCKQAKPVYYNLDIVLNNNKMLEDQEDIILYQQILSFIEHTDAVSISLLQRKFKIGYNRSARIIELLEHNGLIMPADGSKMRRVIR